MAVKVRDQKHHGCVLLYNQICLDCQMPAVIKRAVRKQNVHFLHNRIQYSMEFFQFMRKLVAANATLENSVCKRT